MPSSIIGSDHVPHNISSLGIESDHMGVERPEKNFVTENRKPAIHPPATRTNIARQRMLVHPDRAPGARVERKGAVVLRGGVENAVHHQRRSLQLAGSRGLVHPLRSE